MLENETAYQNELAEIQRQRQKTLSEIQRAIENAKLTGDMAAAEQMAGYLQQAQSYYSDYYNQMLEAQQEAQQEAANPAAATPSFSNIERTIAGLVQTGQNEKAQNVLNTYWNQMTPEQQNQLRAKFG